MFNKGKLLVIGLLGISIIFTGCGTSNTADAKSSLKTAAEKMKAAKSYEMDMVLTMNTSIKDEGTLNMTTSVHEKSIIKPELVKQIDSVVEMSKNGQSYNTEMQQYIIKEDSQYMMYSGADGFWAKAPIEGLEETEKILKSSLSDVLGDLEMIEDISFADEKEINGVECKRIKVNLTNEEFDKTLSGLNAADTMGIDMASLDSTSNTSGDTGSIPIYYYVSKKSGEILGFDVDASEQLRKSIEMADQKEYEFEELKMTIECRISNIDKVSEITLAEEAKSAVEVSLTE